MTRPRHQARNGRLILNQNKGAHSGDDDDVDNVVAGDVFERGLSYAIFKPQHSTETHSESQRRTERESFTYGHSIYTTLYRSYRTKHMYKRTHADIPEFEIYTYTYALPSVLHTPQMPHALRFLRAMRRRSLAQDATKPLSVFVNYSVTFLLYHSAAYHTACFLSMCLCAPCCIHREILSCSIYTYICTYMESCSLV